MSSKKTTPIDEIFADQEPGGTAARFWDYATEIAAAKAIQDEQGEIIKGIREVAFDDLVIDPKLLNAAARSLKLDPDKRTEVLQRAQGLVLVHEASEEAGEQRTLGTITASTVTQLHQH